MSEENNISELESKVKQLEEAEEKRREKEKQDWIDEVNVREANKLSNNGYRWTSRGYQPPRR